MKRLVLFVVAAVFAFTTMAIAADKPAAAPAAAPAAVAEPAKADVKKEEQKAVKK
jgi:Ni/Co efflux regulator RcnB